MKTSFYYLFFVVVLYSCAQPVARKPVVNKTASYLKESVSFNKKLIKEEENDFKYIMLKDSLTTYLNSKNGFWYTYNLKSENTYTPKYSDQVLYTYEVFDLNKNIIYNLSEIGNKSYYIDQESIVEGLRNGLKLMHEGDVVTFLFPSHKVFGYLGDENKIGINQSVIYKVQLNKIIKKNESN